MRISSVGLLLLLLAVALVGMSATDPKAKAARMAALPETPALPAADPNPLLAEWKGPYGGVPRFDLVKVEFFKPAMESAMAENLAEIDKIANDTAAPTFENTIVAMERAGETLNRVGTLYNVWQSTMSTPDFQVVQKEMAPKLAAFSDKITQNEALFKRIEAVYNSPNKAKLNA